MIDANMLRELAEAAWNQPVYPDSRFPPSVYYRFLRLLTERMRPRVSVELGVCGGGASLYMALGHPDGEVIGIDSGNAYLDQIAYVGKVCPNFQYWHRDSIEAADYAFMSWLGTDLAPNDDLHIVSVLFIDTIHTYERTMAEFAAWKPLLALGAVVVLDDLFREGMDRVWQELPGEKVRLDKVHIGGSSTDGGFGVVFNIR